MLMQMKKIVEQTTLGLQSMGGVSEASEAALRGNGDVAGVRNQSMLFMSETMTAQ